MVASNVKRGASPKGRESRSHDELMSRTFDMPYGAFLGYGLRDRVQPCYRAPPALTASLGLRSA